MCSTSVMPAKNAALNVVVAIWETPPPKSSLKMPLLMMKPLTKPFSAVRSPTVPLSENVSPGFDDRPVDQLGGPADVDVAVLRIGVVGRERRDLLLDAQRLGVLGRELRLDHLAGHVHHPLALGPDDQLQERRVDLGLVEADAGLGRDHPRLAASSADLASTGSAPSPDTSPESCWASALGRSCGHQLAAVGHQPQRPRVLPRLERAPPTRRSGGSPAPDMAGSANSSTARSTSSASMSGATSVSASSTVASLGRGTPPRAPSRAPSVSSSVPTTGSVTRMPLGLNADRALDRARSPPRRRARRGTPPARRRRPSTTGAHARRRRWRSPTASRVPALPRPGLRRPRRRSRPRGRPPRARPRRSRSSHRDLEGRSARPPSSSSSRCAASSSAQPADGHAGHRRAARHLVTGEQVGGHPGDAASATSSAAHDEPARRSRRGPPGACRPAGPSPARARCPRAAIYGGRAGVGRPRAPRETNSIKLSDSLLLCSDHDPPAPTRP